MCRILHTPGHDETRDLLDEFLLEHETEIARVLRRAQSIARLDYRDRETVFSYFGQALMQMTQNRWRTKNAANGTSQVFNYSHNLPAILEKETRYWIREDRSRGLLDGTVGVPGDGTRDRRRSLVEKSRQLFEIEHQYDPSDFELVGFHNDRMLATRKDAARQGVLTTKDALRPVTAVSLNDPDVAVHARLSTIDEPDVGAPERARKLADVIERCEQIDIEQKLTRRRRLRRRPVYAANVARAYFARHHEGIFPTRRELVETLGIIEPAARRELTTQLERVLEVSREVFADFLYES